MNTGCSQTFGAMLHHKVVIITIINNKGREFHKFIIEGRKEFKYVSVLAKGERITKC